MSHEFCLNAGHVADILSSSSRRPRWDGEASTAAPWTRLLCPEDRCLGPRGLTRPPFDKTKSRQQFTGPWTPCAALFPVVTHELTNSHAIMLQCTQALPGQNFSRLMRPLLQYASDLFATSTPQEKKTSRRGDRVPTINQLELLPSFRIAQMHGFLLCWTLDQLHLSYHQSIWSWANCFPWFAAATSSILQAYFKHLEKPSRTM